MKKQLLKEKYGIEDFTVNVENYMQDLNIPLKCSNGDPGFLDLKIELKDTTHWASGLRAVANYLYDLSLEGAIE